MDPEMVCGECETLSSTNKRPRRRFTNCVYSDETSHHAIVMFSHQRNTERVQRVLQEFVQKRTFYSLFLFWINKSTWSSKKLQPEWMLF